MKDNKTDAAAAAAFVCVLQQLSLSQPRRKHNHQADDTTCLPLSLI
jgi:hypothetical protein